MCSYKNVELLSRNAELADIVFFQMNHRSEAETHRLNIARYRSLLDYLQDPQMRAHLEKLIKQAEDRLAEIDPDRRS